MAKKLSLPESLFQIINGPSKFDLMASLFEGKIVEITCGFNNVDTDKAGNCPKLEVVFTKVGIKDGLQDSWIGDVDFHAPNYENVRRQYYYDTRRRTGYIREIAK